MCVMCEIQENKKRKWEKMKLEKRKTTNCNNDNINLCVDCKFAGASHSYPSYYIVLECVNDDMINTPDLVYGGRTKNYFAECYEIRKQWGINCPGFVPSSREISIKMRHLIELNNSEQNPRDIVIDDELSASEKIKNKNH